MGHTKCLAITYKHQFSFYRVNRLTMKKTYSLGFSPCPNDTFIFDAMVNGKINSEGLTFNTIMEDVEELNQRAMQGSTDITKLSFFAYSRVAEKYQLLDAGAALGMNCGPLLVTAKPLDLKGLTLGEMMAHMRIAIPGFNTTANALLSHFYPKATNKYACLFSDIEKEVLTGKADAGLIIHEGRFTYQQKGLIKLADMGELWEAETNSPLPLGGIAIRRDLPEDIKHTVNAMVKASVQYAFANPDSGKAYIRQHAQEMEEHVIRQHIELYVNPFSVELGVRGREAVTRFLSVVSPATPFSQGLFLN